jgi:hypothetical protein
LKRISLPAPPFVSCSLEVLAIIAHLFVLRNRSSQNAH